MSPSDVKVMLEVIGFLCAPIFSAGGAVWGVRYALREITSLRNGQRRLDVRVATLYGHLGLIMPSEPSDSPN